MWHALAGAENRKLATIVCQLIIHERQIDLRINYADAKMKLEKCGKKFK
jgi:hypothetical protein